MKRTVLKSLLCLCAILLPGMMHAGATTYYKNFKLQVRNPEPAKGKVYIEPQNDSDRGLYCKTTNDANGGCVDGSLSTTKGEFNVNIIPSPAPGYVFVCLATPAAYASGNYHSQCLSNDNGAAITATYLTLDNDTTNAALARPTADAPGPQKQEYTFYAIFRKATKGAVKNSSAGNLQAALRKTKLGETVNDLTVTGPLNDADLRYLNKLSKDNGLTRLDLSGARFTSIGDSVFLGSGLYELKIPATIQHIGIDAFSNSIGLKPIANIPSKYTNLSVFLKGCRLMKLSGIKTEPDDYKTDDDDDDDYGYGLFDWLLW